MIPIKINGKKQQIKLYSELTLKEYREVINAVAEKQTYNVFDYIAYQIGYTFDALMLEKVSNLELLQDQLGDILVVKGESDVKVKCIEHLPLKRFKQYKGKAIDFSRVKIKSKVGYRVVIEQYLQSKPNYMELYSFVLATIIQERLNGNFDYSSIEEINKNLENENAYHVLGNGAFFLTSLTLGGWKGLRFLRVLKNITTKMRG